MSHVASLSQFDWLDPHPVAVGGFSTVFHAIYKGSHVALKRVLKVSGEAGEQAKRRFLNELDIHTKLRHEAIVPVVPPGFFEDVSDGEAYSYLVTEYCSNGDLLTYLRGRRAAVRGTDQPALHLDEIVHLMRQLCAGVAYLHARGIIHRDIKLRNLLLTSGLTLKIADFGLATVTRWDDMDRFTVCGTPSTAAPEVRPGGSHDLSADIWSMGCVMFTLLTGSAAVNSDKPAGLCELRELRPDFEEKLAGVPPVAQDLVRRMLQQEPWKRPTASDITSHAFFSASLSRPSATVASPDLNSARHAGPTARRRAPLPTPPPDTDVIRSFLSTFRDSQVESNALRSHEIEAVLPAPQPPIAAAAPPEIPLFSSSASSVTLTQSQPAASAALPRLPQSMAVLACVEIELKKLAAQRVQAHRQARAKLRALRRAVISGTGASGDAGAVTVLGIYGQDVAAFSTTASCPVRGSFGTADFSASFSSIRSSSTRQADSMLSSLSYSLPSSAPSTVRRRPAAASHPLAPLYWSGSELGYRFQFCTPKASMCVFNHCILAACHSSGACIQLRADAPAHVLVGSLTGSAADVAFSQFNALCLAVHSSGWPATACDRTGVNVCKEPAWAASPTRLCEWQAEPRALASLRAEHRQLFRFVSHVMTTLCSITPKAVISSATGTGALMDNSPMPDFRFTTADELACVHIVQREGIAVIVNGSSGTRPVAVTVPLTPSVSTATADAEAFALLAEAQHALSACMLKVHNTDG